MATSDVIEWGITEKFHQAETSDNPSEKKETFSEILNSCPTTIDSEVLVGIQEQCIIGLGKQYSLEVEPLDGAQKLEDLIIGSNTKAFLNRVSKAKAGKIVKILVDLYLNMAKNAEHHHKAVEVCKQCIGWAKEERRQFLRQSLEARLISQYFNAELYDDALPLAKTLLKEIKVVDDKGLLVEVQLLESRIYEALGNLQKSRASLTSARTTANSIYCPPQLQASLDMQSGILHAIDDNDFKTAFSYFFEAFEGYDSATDSKALLPLKYMLLCKIMLNQPDDVQGIVSGKLASKYSGRHIEALKAVAVASQRRSLSDFKGALEAFEVELCQDTIISKHLDRLHDTMLEQALSRIIEPYSRVQIHHISKLIQLEQDVVEGKLSQMILDKKLNGILDQGQGIVIIFEDDLTDKTYDFGVHTIGNLGKVVDELFNQAKKL